MAFDSTPSSGFDYNLERLPNVCSLLDSALKWPVSEFSDFFFRLAVKGISSVYSLNGPSASSFFLFLLLLVVVESAPYLGTKSGYLPSTITGEF